MAKPRPITRALVMLETAYEIALERNGKWTIGMASNHPPPGLYKAIPVDDAKDIARMLEREDARESRLEPSLRRKGTKKKAVPKKRKRPYVGL